MAETEGIQRARNDAPGAIVCGSCSAHIAEKFACTAAALRPQNMPSTIRPATASVFAEVKTFWMILPRLSPRVLTQVSNTINTTPTSCWRDKLIAYFSERRSGATIQDVGEIEGASTPR